MLRFAQHEPRGRSSPWDRYPHIMDPDTALTFAWNMGREDGWDNQIVGDLYRVTGPSDEEGLWVERKIEIGNYKVDGGTVLWGGDIILLANALVDKYYTMWFEQGKIPPGNLQENPEWVAFVRKMEKMINEAHAGVDFTRDPNDWKEYNENVEVNISDLRIIYHPNSDEYPQSYHLEIEGGAVLGNGDTLAEMSALVATMRQEQQTVLFMDQNGRTRDISNLFN